MNAIGYDFLRSNLELSALPLRRPARIMPVTRVERLSDRIAIPEALGLGTDDIMDHVLFALKHEGTNLTILAQALPKVDQERLEVALAQSPNGQYLRKAAFLWEHFTGRVLTQSSPARGAIVKIFDPRLYIVGPSRRNSRWRVDFNGLGSLGYCASIEKSPELEALLENDVLDRTRQFIESLPEEMMDRAISWAYLHETKDSFLIEREAPAQDKAKRFMQLLHLAHEKSELTEDYLSGLQNSVVNNKIDQAAAFRHEQNHLHSSMRGAAGVTYIPPEPELCAELSHELMAFANERPEQIPPLVLASVVSFGFVFLHPFMDGNGRLSRFLIHHTLCCSGALRRDSLLPISVAMKKNERGYLEALRSFSLKIRNEWSIRWLDEDQFDFKFNGHDSVYRYWDATDCTIFLLQMADQALNSELRNEAKFLANYDAIYKRLNNEYDVRNSEMSTLIITCLSHGGKVSNNRRKQFGAYVPEGFFEALEKLAGDALAKEVSPEDESLSPS